MSDEGYTFDMTKARLEEILVEVKKKDTSLEKSIELLEEGVRLANRCNELIDRTTWEKEAVEELEGAESDDSDTEVVAVIETVEVVEDVEGDVLVTDTIEVVEIVTEPAADADEAPEDDERA
jgi:exodeoxyribonuclease VII small subunit